MDLVVPASLGWGVKDVVVSYKLKPPVEGVHAKANAMGKSVLAVEHKTYTPGRHGFGV